MLLIPPTNTLTSSSRQGTPETTKRPNFLLIHTPDLLTNMASAANSSTGSNTASELIAPFLKAWGSSVPEELIACYADHGLEYSDYGEFRHLVKSV